MESASTTSLGYAVASYVQNQTSDKVLVITANAAQSHEFQRQLAFFLNIDADIQNKQSVKEEVLFIPDNEAIPFDSFSPGKYITSKRIKSIYRLLNSEYRIVVISIHTLMKLIAPRYYFIKRGLAIKLEQIIDYRNFISSLLNNGYTKCNFVRQPGEVAWRGSIIDMFPTASNVPFRIELQDDSIASLRTFSTQTQLGMKQVKEINILPATEYPTSLDACNLFCRTWQRSFSGSARLHPIYKDMKKGIIPQGIESFLPFFFEEDAQGKETSCLESYFDYLSSNLSSHKVFYRDDIYLSASVFEDEIRLRYEKMGGPSAVLPAPESLYLAAEDIQKTLNPQKNLYYKILNKQKYQTLPDLRANFESDIKLEKLLDFRDRYKGRILISMSSQRRQQVMEKWLRQTYIDYTSYKDWHSFISENSKDTVTNRPKDKVKIGIIAAKIHDGICSSDWAIITEEHIFNENARLSINHGMDNISANKELLKNNMDDISKIIPGELVVHRDYGVGRFVGLENIKYNDYSSEYICIEYAEKTNLYLPVNNIHFLSRYIGNSEREHSLDKLGGKQWNIRKLYALKKIEDNAASLLELYAKRANLKGIKFKSPDNDYEEFCAGFPYKETADQSKAIEELVDDMLTEKKTDRLVCGDIGFGKTEVAMRAAYIAAASEYQVALLAPTTILAEQHLETFSGRFTTTPFIIKSLTRLSDAKKIKQVKEDIGKKNVDIVIGTHAILGKDIKFKNLGLVIIDEEHRFGVRQKEKLKSLRKNVDILSLTATPIPRTLNMALSGLRDISLIASPPPGRLPIKTYINSFSDEIVKEAIAREIMRDGQVYYVYNHIESISEKTNMLKDLFPEQAIAFIHGSMDKWQLKEILHDFYHKKISILVCTNIIENGLDVADANTIIIEMAERFGLAQLHQIRGRVGRRNRQAFAYLLTSGNPPARSKAAKRIKAVVDNSSLGLGFNLAIHDLEIRGAGEILGTEQSGPIQKIGLDLYTEMLEKTLFSLQQKSKNKRKLTEKDYSLHKITQINTEIDLPISAMLPEDYINDIYERLIIYKRMAKSDKNSLKAIADELKDIYGNLPPYAANLFEIHHIRIMAQNLGVSKISFARKEGDILINKSFTHTIKRAQKSPYLHKGLKDNKDFCGLTFSCSSLEDAQLLSEINQILLSISAKQ